MNLALKNNGGFPSLLSNFFTPSSLLGPDFLNIENDLFAGRLGINVPTANIIETQKEFMIELAAPGLERKDFIVEVENNLLKISAEKDEEVKEEDEEYSRREYSYNAFSRIFNLPDNVKEGDIDAKYENGILKISIPKLKETQVKALHKITVS
jgi:HSP20 family protein